MKSIEHEFLIPENIEPQRLDAFVAQLLPDYSRARIQDWIKQGHLTVNQQPARSKDKLLGGETIVIKTELEEIINDQPQNIALDIVYQDDDIIVINKPIDLVTHPAAGNHDGTLLNALLYHFPELATLPRAGIIHRLDKDTSGLMLIAHSLPAHTHLTEQLQARTVHREYLALIPGYLTGGGMIDEPIGRHPRSRLKMAVTRDGKPAVTHIRIAERLPHHTLLQVNLETGRTHQIRVHLSHKYRPIVGDQLYGQLRLPKGIGETTRDALMQFRHQALHAHKLGFEHPTTGEPCEFIAPLPDDFKNLLTILRENR